MNAPEGAARLARLEAAEIEAWRQYEAAWDRFRAVDLQWRRCMADLKAARRERAEGVQS